MSEEPQDLPFTTQPIKAELIPVLQRLRPGMRIRITHLVRVGNQTWPHTVEGTYRSLNSLATGISTQRYPRDDIIVSTLHFIKDNKELSSIALDEHTKIEILSEAESQTQ
jgi:hypothetical protein